MDHCKKWESSGILRFNSCWLLHVTGALTAEEKSDCLEASPEWFHEAEDILHMLDNDL